jgi:hypothetical protein
MQINLFKNRYFWTYLLILASAGVLSLAMDNGERSPHGDDFEISCSKCHSPTGWHFDRSIYSYNHNEVFELSGSHNHLDCRQCHQTLLFKDAPNQCFQCHTDVHQQTVGMSCDRCHGTTTWLVSNLTEIHQNSRFPLLGAHAKADCQQCHTQANSLAFEPLSTDCFACHQADYHATTQPAHQSAGFSTECADCHTVFSYSWSGSFNHHFFPLIQGHALNDCNSCHQNGVYTGLSTDCFSCHQPDFEQTTDPNHVQSGFDTNCNSCHTLSPGWKPSTFDHDTQYFPIYSGSHNGEWNSCTDCHTTGNMASFSCIDCHEHNQSEMDDEHDDVNNYSYNSNRCFDCHSNGSSDDKKKVLR